MSDKPNIRNPEAGLRDHRIEFVRTNDDGELGEEPLFEKYSHTISEFSWTSEAMLEEQRSIGNADVSEHVRGAEEHEIVVNYNLAKWLIDGEEPNDAAYDGIERDADNLLENDHVIVDREHKQSVSADAALGETRRPTRIYVVGYNGLIDELEIVGDPSDSQPVTVELTYAVPLTRTYQIDQPADGPTEIVIEGENAEDEGIDIEIESEGGVESETIEHPGDGEVSTSTEFPDIDSIWLTEETHGDVRFYIDEDGDGTKGDQISVIRGADSYEGIEGDRGIPTLRDGEREDPEDLPPAPSVVGDVIARDTNPVPHEVQSITLNITNNVEPTETTSRFGMPVFPGNREIELELGIYGENASYDLLTDHLLNNAKDFTWQATDGQIVFENMVLTEPGDKAVEEGQSVMMMDNTFSCTGLEVNEDQSF